MIYTGKKILALLLSFVLYFSLLPVSALAEKLVPPNNSFSVLLLAGITRIVPIIVIAIALAAIFLKCLVCVSLGVFILFVLSFFQIFVGFSDVSVLSDHSISHRLQQKYNSFFEKRKNIPTVYLKLSQTYVIL